MEPEHVRRCVELVYERAAADPAGIDTPACLALFDVILCYRDLPRGALVRLSALLARLVCRPEHARHRLEADEEPARHQHGTGDAAGEPMGWDWGGGEDVMGGWPDGLGEDVMVKLGRMGWAETCNGETLQAAV